MTNERLRQHPEERLGAPVQMVDLAATTARLRAESHAAVAGHRQIAVFRSGPVTLVQFVFDTDGLMKEHKAEGVVIIQVLAGKLVVIAEEEAHELCTGQLLALAPDVPHTVRALAPSEMLLAVYKYPP